MAILVQLGHHTDFNYFYPNLSIKYVHHEHDSRVDVHICVDYMSFHSNIWQSKVFEHLKVVLLQFNHYYRQLTTQNENH